MQEMQQTQVRSLGWEDPLEKEVATHSSILAWEIPWTEEPGGLGLPFFAVSVCLPDARGYGPGLVFCSAEGCKESDLM